MAVRYRVRLDDKKLQQQFEQMIREGGDPRPFLKQVGTWMAYKSPQLNWADQGGRYQASGWPELSPMTLALRRWNATADAGSGQAHTEKILEVTGGLKGQGWSYDVRGSGENAYVQAGTKNPNAATHQFGRWIAAPPGWERPMAKVPQRILIAIAPDDMRQAEELAGAHIKRVVPGAH